MLNLALKEGVKREILRYAQIAAVTLLCLINLALASVYGAVVLQLIDVAWIDALYKTLPWVVITNIVAISLLWSRNTSPGHWSTFRRWPLPSQCLYAIVASIWLGAIITLMSIAIDIIPQLLGGLV